MVPVFFALTYSWDCCSQLLWSCRKAHSRLTSDSPGIGDSWWLAEYSLIYLWVQPSGPHRQGRDDWHHFKASPASEALSLPVPLPHHVIQSQTLWLNICNLRTQKAKAGGLPQVESPAWTTEQDPGSENKQTNKIKINLQLKQSSTRGLRAGWTLHTASFNTHIAYTPEWLALRPAGEGSHMAPEEFTANLLKL